jgi:hypothetical protein
MTDVNEVRSTPPVVGGTGRRAGYWVALAAIAVCLAAVGFGLWHHFDRPVSARMDELINLLATDPTAFPPGDSRNRIPLTGRFAGLTAHDEMFLTRRPDGSFLVLFPTYYGSGTSIACLLYTSRPLRATDTREQQSTLGKSERVIDAPPYPHMSFDGRIDEHWYRVSFGMR